MALGPFLRRELATSARGGRAFDDRRIGVFVVASIPLAGMVFWDRQEWDRATILGAHRFGLLVFALMVVGLMMVAFGVIVQQVGKSIASERDRKTLDALLASRFSSFEVVIGAMAAGFLRHLNASVAALPVVVLIVYLGGVAPIWAILSAAGLASLSCLLAGFSVVASVGARTASRAAVHASLLFAAWFALPTLYLVLVRPLLWPGAPAWLTGAFLVLSDGGPMGLLMNGLGVISRPGGPIEAVARMAAWQVGMAVVLTAWATARLRPASRALYDVEGERGRIRRLKAALRRPPRRPPCSDDPVFWCEAYSSRALGLFEALSARAVRLGQLAVVVLLTGYFAGPAFAELLERGYGPSLEAFELPEVHPLIRLLIKARLPALATTIFPGQARLEFNMALRLYSTVALTSVGFAAFSITYESIRGERRRDTWLGLLATSLSAREILRGKALGAARKARRGVLFALAPATVGLAAGAMHPLGYLMAVAFLAAAFAFFAALGPLMALLEWDPATQSRSPARLVHVPIALVGSVVLLVGPIALSWACLLTYEDVAAAIRGGPFPEIREGSLASLVGARGVLFALLAGIAALAAGAWWLDRRNECGFDAAVGRPVRPEG